MQKPHRSIQRSSRKLYQGWSRQRLDQKLGNLAGNADLFEKADKSAGAGAILSYCRLAFFYCLHFQKTDEAGCARNGIAARAR